MSTPDVPIQWVSHYLDGTKLEQFPTEGDKHTYKDIDREKLIAFDLWKDNQLLVRIDLRDDTKGDTAIGRRRLIWRMRHIMRSDGEHERLHMAGWQRKVNGINIQSICYTSEDGVIVLGGQFTGEDFMDPIGPLEWETDLL